MTEIRDSGDASIDTTDIIKQSKHSKYRYFGVSQIDIHDEILNKFMTKGVSFYCFTRLFILFLLF